MLTCSQAPAKKTKSSLNAKGFPDKDGKFDLYIFKNDLSKDFKNDPKLCMWRRDGSSLLQKYLKAQDDDNDKDILFKASSVVSHRHLFGRFFFFHLTGFR